MNLGPRSTLYRWKLYFLSLAVTWWPRFRSVKVTCNHWFIEVCWRGRSWWWWYPRCCFCRSHGAWFSCGGHCDRWVCCIGVVTRFSLSMRGGAGRGKLKMRMIERWNEKGPPNTCLRDLSNPLPINVGRRNWALNLIEITSMPLLLWDHKRNTPPPALLCLLVTNQKNILF